MNDVKTKESRLEELASELAENVTSQKDLMHSFRILMSMTLQKALDAEMDYHLGYKKILQKVEIKRIVEMATSKKPLKAMMVNLKLKCHEIDTQVLNLK